MAEKKAEKVETLYQVHNMVRKVETRLHRAKAASRHRLNLLIGGGLLRIPRGRSVPVTEGLLKQLLPELQRMEKEGKVKVTTMTLQPVDLHTLKPTGPAPKAAPVPSPPKDSAAADKTFEHGVGQNMPTVVGGKAVNQEVVRPAVLEDAVPEGEEEVAEEGEETDEESSDEASSSTGGKAPKRGKRRGR